MLDALADGAVLAGVPRLEARRMAALMMRGAAEMALADGAQHPATLRDQVCSPAGTTIAGVRQLEARG